MGSLVLFSATLGVLKGCIAAKERLFIKAAAIEHPPAFPLKRRRLEDARLMLSHLLLPGGC